MSAHVLVNLLNELGKKIKCEALPSILSVSSNEFNKFNNTGARMLDSIYHMTLKSHFISKVCTKTSRFRHHCRKQVALSALTCRFSPVALRDLADFG